MPTASDFSYQIGRFTGSSANIVMQGTEADWNAHYQLRAGLVEPDPPSWAMQAGSHMESLILDWYAGQIGHPITRRGEVVFHPELKDVCCKLDGFCAPLDAVIEAKFLAPHRQREEINRAYYAQTTLQRLCTSASRAFLVVAQGTSEPIDFEHEHDPAYTAELLRRKDIFLNCLRTLSPPYPMLLPPVVPREKWRTLDVVAEPTNWSAELFMYLNEYDATSAAAASHEAMGKAARDLVPDDVGKVFAGEFQITRNRKGNLAITRRAAA
ncbi:YqaJ viral recombinase family protein [Bradyrhizobium zhanjiangense]|nr:YqaJ viral recombinase family protein [Bradyrhizobium zhanjiangense]